MPAASGFLGFEEHFETKRLIRLLIMRVTESRQRHLRKSEKFYEGKIQWLG